MLWKCLSFTNRFVFFFPQGIHYAWYDWVLPRHRKRTNKIFQKWYVLFFLWNSIWLLPLGRQGGKGTHTLAESDWTNLLTGKDLGLAFEIPPHIRNQALFAACVLKVTGILQMSKMIIVFLSLLMSYFKYKIYIATYTYCSCACKVSFF